MTVTVMNVGSKSAHYNNGRADFFAGHIRIPPRTHADAVPKPVSAWEFWKLRTTLTGVQEDYFHGWFDARETCVQLYEGTLPPSTRPMVPVQAVARVLHPADDVDTEVWSSKGARRKHGDEVVTIRTNASGTTITWRRHVFNIDLMSDKDKAVLMDNLSAMLYPKG